MIRSRVRTTSPYSEASSLVSDVDPSFQRHGDAPSSSSAKQVRNGRSICRSTLLSRVSPSDNLTWREEDPSQDQKNDLGSIASPISRAPVADEMSRGIAPYLRRATTSTFAMDVDTTCKCMDVCGMARSTAYVQRTTSISIIVNSYDSLDYPLGTIPTGLSPQHSVTYGVRSILSSRAIDSRIALLNPF